MRAVPTTAGRDVAAATVQLPAVAMVAAHAAMWMLVSRWARRGRTARLRASLPLPPLAVRGGHPRAVDRRWCYVALVVPLLYAAVAIAPGGATKGWLSWSSRIDVSLQVAGLGLWAAGMIVLVWAARVLGRYLDVDGVTEDHELVASGRTGMSAIPS